MESGIGRNLRALREAAGLTREQLAVKAGRSSATVIRIENGSKHSPNLETLSALAGALGVTLARLLGDTEAVA